MTSKWIKQDWAWIALLGLLVQAVWGLRIEYPTYFDAYYYTINGQQLAAGKGFTEPIIWQYLDDPVGVPGPSHTYWMPLTSMVAAMGYWLFDSFRGAQLPFWLMAGLLPLLSYAISLHLAGDRWQARTAALFTMAGGYYAAYWVQPSTFALFAWVGGGCLFALALAGRPWRGRYWLAAGVLAGLAHLTRADGILLVPVAAGVWLLAAWSGRTTMTEPPTQKMLLTSLLLFGSGYLLIMGGWFWRTWQLSGRLLSTVGMETIFLTNYDDLFAFGRHFDLTSYLAWGWPNILRSKLNGVWDAAQTYLGVVGLTAFSFFVVLAWVRFYRQERTRPFLRPMTWYAVLLFVVMSLVFTLPGRRGSLFHSSVALWPWSMTLASAGLGMAIDWIAARRRNWRPATARPFFAITLTVLMFVITVMLVSGHPQYPEVRVYPEVAAQLPPGALVMTGSPPSFYFHTGRPAIVVPNEPPEGMLAAANRYGATYLLLDRNRPLPLAGLYEGDIVVGVEWIQSFDEGLQLYRLRLDQQTNRNP